MFWTLSLVAPVQLRARAEPGRPRGQRDFVVPAGDRFPTASGTPGTPHLTRAVKAAGGTAVSALPATTAPLAEGIVVFMTGHGEMVLAAPRGGGGGSTAGGGGSTAGGGADLAAAVRALEARKALLTGMVAALAAPDQHTAELFEAALAAPGAHWWPLRPGQCTCCAASGCAGSGRSAGRASTARSRCRPFSAWTRPPGPTVPRPSSPRPHRPGTTGKRTGPRAADTAGTTGRGARRRGPQQQGDRRAAVHIGPDGGSSSVPGLPQARHQLARGAPRRAR